MGTIRVFLVVLGIAAVTVVISVFGVRLLIRRMDNWADRTIFSFFGSPQELVRRLREKEGQKAQHDEERQVACVR